MNISVERDDSVNLQNHIKSYHYLHKWPDPRSLPFGYRLVVNNSDSDPLGMLWGAMVFKKLQHHEQKGLFVKGAESKNGLPTEWQVLDMARVWIHPALQEKQGSHSLCIFSQFVSKVLKRLNADWLEHHPPVLPHLPYHLELVMSYCELAHHDGTAYRACSFQKWGLSSDGTKEVYIKHLRPPQQRWQPKGVMQLPLLPDTPIKHYKVGV